jgi:hypothetical protein
MLLVAYRDKEKTLGLGMSEKVGGIQKGIESLLVRCSEAVEFVVGDAAFELRLIVVAGWHGNNGCSSFWNSLLGNFAQPQLFLNFAYSSIFQGNFNVN